MVDELYTSVAPAVPIAALFISLLSLIISLRNRTDQRTVILLSKKTEIIQKLAQRQSKLGQLGLVYAQHIQLLEATFGESQLKLKERQRLSNNLALAINEKKNCDELLDRMRETPPTDLVALEGILSTANEFLTHICGELEKEQNALNELKAMLK